MTKCFTEHRMLASVLLFGLGALATAGCSSNEPSSNDSNDLNGEVIGSGGHSAAGGTAGVGNASSDGISGGAGGDAGAQNTGGNAGAQNTGGNTGSGNPTALPWGKPTAGVFVHLFEWRWDDVARECEEYLGPNGFAAVQISPPNEHAVLGPNYPWWQRYQPVSYSLVSRSGNAEQLSDMVTRCAEAGVAIYADAVINHMADQGSVGSAGTAYSQYNYGSLYGPSDFHAPACQISPTDYATSADNVRSCELSSLPDLRTENATVRQKIADYLMSMVDLGVRGFRIDAAKHMAPADIDAIITLVRNAAGPDRSPYFFLEVIDPGNEAINAGEYINGITTGGNAPDVNEFRFGWGLRSRFNSGNISNLDTLVGGSMLPSDRAVPFSNNHDEQRSNRVLAYRDGALHDLANIFLLAWPYGYPMIMSSYAFDLATEHDRGPPSNGAGATSPVVCAANRAGANSGEWVCEHRAPHIAGMVRFRSQTAGAAVTNWWDNGSSQIAFGRGNLGFVAINAGSSGTLLQTLQTGLPAGTYCDVISGGAACSTTVVVDAGGVAQLNVAAQAAIAFHVGAKQ